MNSEAFLRAYGESRNGTDNFHVNRLYPRFLYSDGVRECADAGCYWLLDILGTEITAQDFARRESGMCVVRVFVAAGRADTLGEFRDGDPAPYKRRIEATDLPDGEWVFYLCDDGDGFLRCILPTEY